mmetsp:Transcript_9020/g.15843  ORF Transcript_9020/g.15843 Transcript_9020/m.15843 type:complete len:114 (+) Transcript_9020:81-422(+)
MRLQHLLDWPCLLEVSRPRRSGAFLEAPRQDVTQPRAAAFYAGNACSQDPSHCVLLKSGFQSLAHDFCKDSGQPDWCKKESQSAPQCLCPGRTDLYLEAHPEETSKFDRSGCP